MKEITFNKDQIIFRQGDFATVMYDILSGKVGIYKDYGTETEKQIAVLKAGQTLGEMGMLEFYPRSATAVALEDTVVTELGEQELKEYFKNKPEKLLLLMKTLSQRIRETTQKYVDVCRAMSELREAEEDRNFETTKKIRQEIEEHARYYDIFME